MPTGYTAGVQSGEIVTLEQYAMTCARAFGALVSMRDQPLDSTIPEKLYPNPSYERLLNEAIKEEEIFLNSSEEELRKMYLAEHEEAMLTWKTRLNNSNLHSQRYNQMLEKVVNWEVPESLSRLKDFMEEQLNSGKNFDCVDITKYDPKPIKKGFPVWKYQKQLQLRKSVDRCKKEYHDEIKRVEERNKWLADLRQSLKDVL